MGLPRFFVDSLHAGRVTLSEAESRHAQASRRLTAGEEVALFDGRGNEAIGVLAAEHSRKRQMEVDAGELMHRPRPSVGLTLAVSMPKGPRQDWLIEKATELGVAAIIPLQTARTISGASPHRLDKWRQTAIEAAKQSGQAWLPDLHAPEELSKVLGKAGDFDKTFMLAASASRGPDRFAWGASTLVLVGPEGDWTPEEIQQASAAGIQLLSLGPNILRVETAAIAIAALAHAAG